MPISLKEFFFLNEITARKGPRTGAFELDKNKIIELAKKIVKDLYNNKVFAYYTLSLLSPIDSKEHKIRIEPKYDIGGGLGQIIPQTKIIQIKVPTFDELLKQKRNWAKEIFETLVHEITHYFDKNLENHKGTDPEVMDGSDEEIFSKYLNDPIEQKAYIHQIVHEIMQELNRFSWEEWQKASFDRPFYLLELSEAGLKYLPFMNDKMKQKLFKALADIWQNHYLPRLEELRIKIPRGSFSQLPE